MNKQAMLGGGILAAIVGGIIWLLTANAASECGSILVRAFAQSQCTQYTAMHTIGMIIFLAGVACAVIGGVQMRGH